MTAIIQILEAVGTFIVGVAARGALVLGVILVLSLPVMLMALTMRAAEELKRRQLGLRDVAGFVFRPDLWYAPTHTWLARRQGGTLAVGLDDLALRLMPSVTGLEVPRPGTRIERGEPLATLYAGSRSLVIPSPVSGTVAGVNRAALRDPMLVKREGYGRGWVVAMAPSNEAYADLPRGERAERFMRAESARWTRFMEDELGFAAADGGHLVAPAPSLVGEMGWKRLTAAFVGA
ncbi:MAG: glycine cleavage system protein H [Anaeromyxobacter sp.]|nr:glycine cleavage system protein H [Anaeromyxobacter sp.]MBL0277165.1 glycine cleavage system protein H [Anaeromyxobacter sp.]